MCWWSNVSEKGLGFYEFGSNDFAWYWVTLLIVQSENRPFVWFDLKFTKELRMILGLYRLDFFRFQYYMQIFVISQIVLRGKVVQIDEKIWRKDKAWHGFAFSRQYVRRVSYATCRNNSYNYVIISRRNVIFLILYTICINWNLSKSFQTRLTPRLSGEVAAKKILFVISQKKEKIS